MLLGATAVFFTYWKSPASDQFISLVNGILPYTVGRVVDWWDVTAVITLVPVWWLTRGLPARRLPMRHGWQYAVLGVSVFSFAATGETLPTDVSLTRSYTFSIPADSVRALLRVLPDSVTVMQEDGVRATLSIPWQCTHGLAADVRVQGAGSRATLWLDRLWSYCHKGGTSNAELHWLFERRVVHPIVLHAGPAEAG